MKSKLRTTLLSAAGALSLALPLGAAAQTVEWKLSHWVPPTHSLHKSLQAWSASIGQATGGSFKVNIFPAQQLGKAFDHYDMAAKGIAEMTFVNVGYQPGRMPVANAIQLPFMATNGGDGSRAYDEWYRPHATKDMPGVRYCFGMLHDPGTLHTKKQVTMPEDLRGMKIRPAHAQISEWMKQLGAVPVSLSAPEVREALERGVADGLTFPWDSIFLFGADRTARYHIDARMYSTGFAFLINPDRYQALSAAHKKALDDHCSAEWAHRFGVAWAEVEESGRTKAMKDKAHTLVTLKPEQLEAWRKSAEPVYAAWREEVRKAGEDPDALLKSLRATLTKYKSQQ